MSAAMAVVPTHILRRWDALAAVQLCDAVRRQAEEMDRLRTDIRHADEELDKARESTEFWREQALDMQLQLCDRDGTEPGITQGCKLVSISPDNRGAL